MWLTRGKVYVMLDCIGIIRTSEKDMHCSYNYLPEDVMTLGMLLNQGRPSCFISTASWNK